MKKRSSAVAGAIALAAIGGGAEAQESSGSCPAGETSCTVGDRVIYLPAFFTQFNPVTALDMVSRVPGFSIDAGEDVRGFGAAAGNVLIDGQRPSTKSTDLFTVLSRIAAEGVERIELIRGGSGGLDVAGQAVVVNVVKKTGDGAGEPSIWEFALVKRRPDGFLRPAGSATFNGEALGMKYGFGVNAYGFALRFTGSEDIDRFTEIDERRLRAGEYHEQGGGANLRLEKPFDNGDVARLNLESEYEHAVETIDEGRTFETGPPGKAAFDRPFEELSFELGADFEHAFSDTFNGKVIAVFDKSYEKFESAFDLIPAAGPVQRSIFNSSQTSAETIGRIEFGFTGLSDHSIQFGGEFARNTIDSSATLRSDPGSGVFSPVPIAGANTLVAELRGEAFISDSWKVSPKLTIDLAFAMEMSRIRQSGDSANSRFFTYPKPSLNLAYAPNDRTQWRVGAERTVAQLDFDEFVSAVNFDDSDIDFGNPDLRPQRVWEFSLTHERRFGDVGVVELTGFYHYVQDVQDSLPIGGIVEVPGNIGDGRIYGATLDLTAPLGWIGLKNARLQSSTTARDSSVTDPVTGRTRDFSGRPDLFYELEFRQDFPTRKASWGLELFKRDPFREFGLDEVSVFRAETEFNVYVETTRFKGVKARFEVNDVINVTDIREREVFAGSRAAAAPLAYEVRRNNNGGGLRLELSGTF